MNKKSRRGRRLRKATPAEWLPPFEGAEQLARLPRLTRNQAATFLREISEDVFENGPSGAVDAFQLHRIADCIEKKSPWPKGKTIPPDERFWLDWAAYQVKSRAEGVLKKVAHEDAAVRVARELGRTTDADLKKIRGQIDAALKARRRASVK